MMMMMMMMMMSVMMMMIIYDDDDNDKLTIIMKWLKVLPWKGSISWCQQKIPCRTVAMSSAVVFLACLDK